MLKLWHALPAAAQEREAKTLAKASYLLARMQVDRDPEGALPLLEQAAEHDSGDHDKHYMLGKTYRRVGQSERGLAELVLAQRIKPGRVYIELELADAYAAAGLGDEAVRHLRRALRGARGWQAWKAARVALAVGQPDDAQRILDTAARDRKVKRSAQYQELKAQADAAAPERVRNHRAPKRSHQGGSSEHARGGPGHAGTGRVHHVRSDRGFGFLVDDADGARCYFKLKGDSFADGQAVKFVRSDTERGPAARDVRAAA